MNARVSQGSAITQIFLHETFDPLEIISGGNFPADYDIRPTEPALTVMMNDPGYALRTARFGVWEPWMARSKKTYATFNARSETAMDSRLFAPLIKAGQWCAAPATGWYEWSGPKGNKRRWHFSVSGGEPFFMGGLYQRAEEDGEEVWSFTLLTVPANAVVGEYHSTPKDPGGRMPVLLDGEAARDWLDPDRKKAPLIKPWPADETEVWEVASNAPDDKQAEPL